MLKIAHDSGKARALIVGGIFAWPLRSAAAPGRLEVYPGCAEPGPTGKVWYVDPVNGKTPADGGDGSPTAPWNSLARRRQLVKAVRGYTRPLLSSVPYVHIVERQGRASTLRTSSGARRVQPGDTIMLMSGNYGDIVIGDYLQQFDNPGFVTIAAAPGQTPVLSRPCTSARPTSGCSRASRCRACSAQQSKQGW